MQLHPSGLAAAEPIVSAGQLLEQAQALGYELVRQAAWPNGAGWIAMASTDGNSELLIQYGPDGHAHSRVVTRGVA